MAVNEHWQYQGRQQHQWFGHGTAPKDGKGQVRAEPATFFDPFSTSQRIDYASGSVVAHAPRDQRSRWDARIGGTNQDSLKTAVAVWYGASKLSRDAFRQQLLDAHTSDETVDRLRNAAKGLSTLEPTSSSQPRGTLSPGRHRRSVQIGGRGSLAMPSGKA